MARLVCAFLLLAVASASASDDRIIGGYPSAIERFPSTFQLLRPISGVWFQYCSGCILTSKYMLSTASCFRGPEEVVTPRRRVVAGSTARNGPGQLSDIARIIKHPHWFEGLDRDGDLAIIELWTPLQYSSKVQQATIMAQSAFVPDNLPAIVAGYGMTFNELFPRIFSKYLRELDVVTVNNQRCALNYQTIPIIPLSVTPNMICAGSLGYSGPCLGDRGSPLFANDITIGMASWGHGCTNETLSTVYTKISSYTNWIVANVV